MVPRIGWPEPAAAGGAGRAAGHRPGEADALNAVGWCHAQLGEHAAALRNCAEAICCYTDAIDVHGDADDLGERADMLIHLGDAEQAAGHEEAARSAWQRALAILDDLADPAADQVREKLSRSAGTGTESLAAR